MNGNDLLARLSARVDNTVAKAAAEQEEREGPRCNSVHLFVDEAAIAAQAHEDDPEKPKQARVEARLTLVDTFGPFAGEYGDRFAYKFFLEGTCNVLMWWSGSKPPMKKGETLLLKFTVTKHDEYNGTKQTVINRVAEVKAGVEQAKARRSKNRAEGLNDDGTPND